MCDGSRRRSIHLHLCGRLRWRHLQPDRDRYSREEPFWRRKHRYMVHFTSPLSSSLPSGPCSPNPCKNDGSCEVIAPTRRGDVFNEYVCKCQPGFEGVHCQISRLPLDVINETELFVLTLASKQQHVCIYYKYLCCQWSEHLK